MEYATLYVCTRCGTVSATDADTGTTPNQCEACGGSRFVSPRLAAAGGEADRKRNAKMREALK